MNLIGKRYAKGLTLAALIFNCTLLSVIPAWAETTQPKESGPGVPRETTESMKETDNSDLPEGTSLGIFTTTGYCNCNKCSGGHNLTYSGTIPQAKHTLSADTDLLPLGTKVRIGDVIYTVEDIGSSVDDKKVDIYFGSHDEAWAHGMQEEEVFLVEKPSDTEA